MKERPILFKERLVRANLEGRKWQTRRVIPLAEDVKPDGLLYHWLTHEPAWGIAFHDATTGAFRGSFRNRYGSFGDALWVRETWHSHALADGDRYCYRATPPIQPLCDGVTPWKPSIHMPRVACRLRLRVREVRVERLQDITEEDAIAEGVPRAHPAAEEGEAPCGDGSCGGWLHPHGIHCNTAREVFRDLWDSINADRGFGWHANPWVWAISYEVIKE